MLTKENLILKSERYKTILIFFSLIALGKYGPKFNSFEELHIFVSVVVALLLCLGLMLVKLRYSYLRLRWQKTGLHKSVFKELWSLKSKGIIAHYVSIFFFALIYIAQLIVEIIRNSEDYIVHESWQMRAIVTAQALLLFSIIFFSMFIQIWSFKRDTMINPRLKSRIDFEKQNERKISKKYKQVTWYKRYV